MGVLEQNNRKKGLLLGQDGNSLIILISISAIVFAIVNFIKIGYHLADVNIADYYTNVLNWFIIPAKVERFLGRPWTLISYIFTHESVWHMISNMLWLWSFGFIMQELAGNKHIAPLFLYGGIAGAVIFLTTVNGIPVLRGTVDDIAPLQGGGPAILAVALGTTSLAPRYRIFPFLNGGIPLWVLTLVFIVVDFAFISRQGVGVASAHIGGGLMGLLYTSRLKTGKDWGLWMHQLYEWFFGLFDPEKKKPGRQEIRQELFYQNGKQLPYKKTPIVTQQRIDEILDKINQHGFHYLSDEEKEYLKTASKQEL